MANLLQSASLDNFHAQVIVDQEIKYTIVGGRFSPAISIDDVTSQVVILSVVGARGFRSSLPLGSFERTTLGGYIASDKRRLRKSEILLQPFSHGIWAYSACIAGFAPESQRVTVSLMIGGQAGRTTVNVYSI